MIIEILQYAVLVAGLLGIALQLGVDPAASALRMGAARRLTGGNALRAGENLVLFYIRRVLPCRPALVMPIFGLVLLTLAVLAGDFLIIFMMKTIPRIAAFGNGESDEAFALTMSAGGVFLAALFASIILSTLGRFVLGSALLFHDADKSRFRRIRLLMIVVNPVLMVALWWFLE